MSHDLTSTGRSSSATPPLNGHYQSRVGDYHMSRQNPNVLDQMYSSNHSTQESNGVYVLGSRDSPYSPVAQVNGHHTLGMSPRARGVSQVSFLRQMLNSRRARSASPGLVQLANRKTLGRPGRLLRNGLVGGSPVTVKLAGVKKGAEEERGKLQPSRVLNGGEQKLGVPNPCDKEAVLSALRQKR